MAINDFNKPHFFLNSNAKTKNFTSPGSGGGGKNAVPVQDRAEHSGKLRGDLANISTKLEALKDEVSEVPLTMGIGIQVAFESFPDVDMAVESLANAIYGVELHNVRTQQLEDKLITQATVFIPDGKLHVFEQKIADYLAEKKNKNGKPIDNQKLIDSIESIRTAAFSAMWSDNDNFLPTDKDETVWWEIWVSTPRKSRSTNDHFEAIIADFKLLANKVGINVSQHKLRFPEHTIIQVSASQNQLESNALLLSRIAEIRAPKVTAEFFDSSDSEDQRQWSEDLLDRLEESGSDSQAPYVCILDTGVNVEHPLLAPFSSVADQLTVTEDGDPSDSVGHGTQMAGLAIWGDLTDIMGATELVNLSHCLESVKVISRDGDNKSKPLGKVTFDAVATAEIANPERERTFSMSLSANTGTDRGRPSSWSSSLDSLAVDYLGEGANPRLFTVCAGNTSINCSLPDDFVYPGFNDLQDIHDPAQAWNVLSVGAYTSKVNITESCDYTPLAKAGGLSPNSTTSVMWDRKNAPIKPEVVFEGGNIGKGELDYNDGLFDLQLLTTNRDFNQKYLTTSNGTSAATALAARFTAQVKSKYSDLWPETIRALTVHSAEWTDEMLSLVNENRNEESIRKSDIAKLLRIVGFGVPNLEQALNSASNSLALVIQDELQPFTKDKDIKTKDLHLHELPWPKESLQALGGENVEMTVTLSYFIEPNPSSRNILNKYSYASHQLRFDVKRPTESDDDFQKRINIASRADKEDKPGSSDDTNWLVGIDGRHKGSIHKDIWRGSAAELAERGQIAIYPASGWWRTRTSHQRFDSKARYSLVVSVSVPEIDVDIYTEVENKISAIVSAAVEIDL